MPSKCVTDREHVLIIIATTLWNEHLFQNEEVKREVKGSLPIATLKWATQLSSCMTDTLLSPATLYFVF